MVDHIHIGLIEALRFWMYVIIIGFFWRLGQLHLAQTDNVFFQMLGKAMAFIY